MKNMFELALKRQAEKLKANKQIKKAIAIVREGVKKKPSVDLYTYLGVLYFDDGNFLQAAYCFAKTLGGKKGGGGTPFLLFNFFENELKKINVDIVHLMYELAMMPDIDNQLRFKLYRNVIYKLFICEKTKLTLGDAFKIHKKVLKNIPSVNFDKQPPQKNKDVMILCGQFISAYHGPTFTALSMAKHIREMGWNPILLCLNTTDLDSEYCDDGYISNRGLHQYYTKHADFDLDSKKLNINTPGAYPFSTVKFQDEQYPFFFIDIPFAEKCEKLPYMFSDAINNENVMISIGSSDVFFDVLGRYTKIYMLPLSFGLPYTMTNYPLMYGKPTSDEIKIIEDNGLYPNGLMESRPPYFLRFKYEAIDRMFLPEQLEFIIVGHRLESEIEALFIQRMAVIKEHYPKVIFKFIGNITQQDDFIRKLCAAGLSQRNILLAGASSDMRASLEGVTFYLNPRRMGGGTSSMEALSLGVPIITYPLGDVYHACGERFGFSDDQAMLTFIDAYLIDADLRQETSMYCEQRYRLNTDVKAVITELTRGEIQ